MNKRKPTEIARDIEEQLQELEDARVARSEASSWETAARNRISAAERELEALRKELDERMSKA